MGGGDGMKYILIPRGDGYITHSNVDPETMSLPNDVEVYDTYDEFQDRLSDLD